MTLKINDPEDKEQFEDKVAHLRALLIQETINRLEVTQTEKDTIKNEIIKIFSQLWIWIAINIMKLKGGYRIWK